MIPPNADNLRVWAPHTFPWATYGMADDAGGAQDARLEKQIAWAWGYIEEVTGRDLDALADSSLSAIAEQAIVLRIMQRSIAGGSAAVKVLSKPWLKSFTAGSYSETRFSPSELGGNSKDVLLKINPLMELAMLLWLLMTAEKREYWLEVFAGKIKPAGRMVEMDFSGGELADADPYDEQGIVT